MKKLSIFLILVLGLTLIAGTAMAAYFGDGGSALQGVLNNITVGPNPGNSSVNVLTDNLPDGFDAYWAVTATGGSVSTMIIELAGFAPNNIFGVYDASNPMTKVQLFAGANGAGDQVALSIKASGDILVNFGDTGIDFAGTTFGYYLDSSFYPTGGVWYSDTALNTDQFDHMYAYQGKNIDTVQLPSYPPGLWTDNEYIFAFEDLDFSVTDADFTDMVVMVESVKPVPEPGTLALLGSGLISIGIYRWRKMKK